MLAPTPTFLTFCSVYICYCTSIRNQTRNGIPLVHTSYGIVQGYYHKNSNVFLGIPYASPPVGLAKFKKPIDPRPWNGTRLADRFGPMCPQMSSEKGPASEDCLYLNIFTPNLSASALLPIIVWVHGGGYESGSGSDFSPDLIIANFVSSGVVFITFNYRLNFYGFFTLSNYFPSDQRLKSHLFPPNGDFISNDDIFPPNRGLWDHLHALKWIQRNIQRFGGDPTKVTLIGNEAGASSIGFLLYSPSAQGTFQRAILHNGSPFSPFPAFFNTTARFQRNKMILDFLGCDLKMGIDELERCVSSASQGQIWNSWRQTFNKISLDIPAYAKWMPTQNVPDGIATLTMSTKMMSENIEVIIGSVKRVNGLESGLSPLAMWSAGNFTKDGFNEVVSNLLQPFSLTGLDMFTEMAKIVYADCDHEESDRDGWKNAISELQNAI